MSLENIWEIRLTHEHNFSTLEKMRIIQIGQAIFLIIGCLYGLAQSLRWSYKVCFAGKRAKKKEAKDRAQLEYIYKGLWQIVATDNEDPESVRMIPSKNIIKKPSAPHKPHKITII